VAGDLKACPMLVGKHPERVARTTAACQVRWRAQLPALVMIEACAARSALERFHGAAARMAAGTLWDVARRHHREVVVAIVGPGLLNGRLRAPS
jgi:hypothetical protein